MCYFKWQDFFLFYSWIIFHYIYLNFFIQWVLTFFPFLGYCKQCFDEWWCICLFEFVFSFSLEKFLEAGLMDHRVVIFVISWGASILFSIVAASVYIPINSTSGSPFLHILAHTFYFLFVLITFLTGVRWYVIVVLISVSLMINHWASFHVPFGHLYVFLENYLFRGFAHFKSNCWFFSYWIVFVLYIFECIFHFNRLL